MSRSGTELEMSAARLRGYVATLARARAPLLAWILICLALGAAYALLSPPMFVGRVSIEIGPRAIANDGPEDVRHFHQIDIDAEQAETELWIMTSDRVLRRVFDDLGLKSLPELKSGGDGLLTRIAGAVRRVFGENAPSDAGERAYAAFHRQILCLRVGGAYVFEIDYRSHDPVLAARVANAIAAAYLADRIERERIRRAGAGGPYQVARAEALGRELLTTRAAGAEGQVPQRDLFSASARILSSASPPLTKTFPKLVPTLLLSLAIAMISGAAAALMSAPAPGGAPPERRRVINEDETPAAARRTPRPAGGAR